jgi:hypothetical protein
MSANDLSQNQTLLRLVESLKELELIIGGQARTVVENVRDSLLQAVAARDRGDLAGAIEQIRAAMERLAALSGSLDAQEGFIMREITARFVAALGSGDRSTAKETLNIIRHKAGDPKDEDRNDW